VSYAHVKYLLVGAGAANAEAAAAIRRIDPAGPMMLVGREVHRPYDRRPLDKSWLSAGHAPPLVFRHEPDWYHQNDVTLRTGRRAVHLDTTRLAVTLDNGEEIAFERLLIGTGASPRHLPVPGADLPNVLYLRTADEAVRVRRAVDKALAEGLRHPDGRGRALVVGGGLLGVEAASSLRTAGLHVDLVVAWEHPWKRFAGPTSGGLVRRTLESRGVQVHAPASVTRLPGDGRAQRAELSTGTTIGCDLVLVAIGVGPNKEVLRGTSIRSERAILVDEHCRTSHQSIWAAGDCAAVFDARSGRYRAIPHWEGALTMGRIAGASMAGHQTPWRETGEFSTRLFDMPVHVWGDALCVTRRIVRAPGVGDHPSMIEFGVDANDRIAQIVAIGDRHDSRALRELVQQQVGVAEREHILRDPDASLGKLL